MQFTTAISLVLGLIGLLVVIRPSYAQDERMGPRDVAEIPIENVPDWVSEGVMRSIPDPDSQIGVSIEVLAVLRDPRDVPIDRFLYALTDDGEVLVHPQAEAIRKSLEGGGHSAVAVYVRTTAPAEICDDCIERDPFFVQSLENIENNPQTYDAPWFSLGVVYAEEGVSVLPCLEPMTVSRRAQTFSAPDTGESIRPDEYLPPRPHYVVTDNRSNPDQRQGEMAAGEVREGWVLCLSADRPADEVRIVQAYSLREDVTTYRAGIPLWVPIEEIAIGEWVLLEGRQVLGWNEDPRQVRGSDPIRLDEQVVYEGDVWVSVAQALRHLENAQMDIEGNEINPFMEELRLQLYFDGMDELLDPWDQLALKDGLPISAENKYQEFLTQLTGPRVVDLSAQGSSISVYSGDFGRSEGELSTPTEVMWVYAGDMREPEGAGPIRMWRVEFEEIDERDLTTEALCEVTECVPVPIGPIGIKVDTPIPVIPIGTRAYGITVKNAKFIRYPILNVRDLDVYLDDGGVSRGEKWLAVEVNVDAMGSNLWQIRYFGAASGYEVIGGEWTAFARSGEKGLLIAYEVAENAQLDLLILTPNGDSPVYQLR